MPYEVLGKVGLSSGILIVMAVLIWEWIKNNKMMHKENKEFVNSVMEKCDSREKSLMCQLDKYNNALENNNKILDKISRKMDIIPKLQEDIEQIKDILDIDHNQK